MNVINIPHNPGEWLAFQINILELSAPNLSQKIVYSG
jgi:hypothetical protein